jgi:hypothetical protein
LIDGQLENHSELLLSTVDFQTGELLALSDQDCDDTRSRCDIEAHALASIVLPLVAKARTYAHAHAGARQGFYLDGGVRSTVPLLPVVERGADRVLLVSSAPSVIEGAPAPKNGLDLLKRYIDIETGHTVEEGIAFAEALARLRRAREREACARAAPPARCAEVFGEEPHIAGDAREPVTPPFAVLSIFRDEVTVPAAAGYAFEPNESLALFLAGVAAARRRCADLLTFFDIGVTERTLGWCEATVPPRRCDGVYFPFERHEGPRGCDGLDPMPHLPPCTESHACGGGRR